MGDFPKLLLAVLCPECEGIDRREAWDAVCRHPLYMSLLAPFSVPLCLQLLTASLFTKFFTSVYDCLLKSFSLHYIALISSIFKSIVTVPFLWHLVCNYLFLVLRILSLCARKSSVYCSPLECLFACFVVPRLRTDEAKTNHRGKTDIATGRNPDLMLIWQYRKHLYK